MIFDPHRPSEGGKNEFQQFQESMRKLNRRCFVRIDKSTYIRPEDQKKIKGKSAKRAAKRERVRQLKESQNA
jgi:hypothetical protein